jgi:cysteine-rich repeat protein
MPFEMSRWSALTLALVLAACAACGSSSAGPDAAPADASSATDAQSDGSPVDARADAAVDARPVDATPIDAPQADASSPDAAVDAAVDAMVVPVPDAGPPDAGPVAAPDAAPPDAAPEVCGDGVVAGGEICDDGNQVSGDGCRADCSGAEICGDGRLDVGEDCDDGNHVNGDGCRADCRELAHGRLWWARPIPDPVAENEAYGFTVAPLAGASGFVVGGWYNYTSTFGPGEAHVTTLTAPYFGYAPSSFFARYDVDGRLVWARSSAGNQFDSPYGSVGLSDGSVVISGFMMDECNVLPCSTTFGVGEPNQTSFEQDYDGTTAPYRIGYLLRLGADGKLMWARRIVTHSEARPYRVTRLSDDSVVVVGAIYGPATFGQGEAHETTLTSDFEHRGNLFVARYGSDGRLMWARQTTGSCNEIGLGVTQVPGEDAVILGGRFGNDEFTDCELVFDEGTPSERRITRTSGWDGFLSRFAADGTTEWVQVLGQANGGNDSVDAVTATADGTAVYVTGELANGCNFTGCGLVFAPGEPGQTTLASGGYYSYLAKYDADGSFLWARRVAGGTRDLGTNLASLPDGAVAMSGAIHFDETFGDGGGPSTVVPMTCMYYDETYRADLFVARYEADGALGWVHSAPCGAAFGMGAIANGPVVITGYHWWIGEFGAGEPLATIVDPRNFQAPENDPFLAGYQP